MSCRSVSELVRPSLIAIVRRTCADTAGSWVTTSTVTPSSVFAVCSAANTSRAVALSSSPVGSSASRTRGLFASAVAIAVRCCSPPDIWDGLRPAQWLSPSTSSSSPARLVRGLYPSPANRIGMITFCSAVR